MSIRRIVGATLAVTLTSKVRVYGIMPPAFSNVGLMAVLLYQPTGHIRCYPPTVMLLS